MSTEEIQLMDIQKKREEKRQLKLKNQIYFESKIRPSTTTSVNLTEKNVSDQVQGRAKTASRPTTTSEPFADKNGKLFGFTQARSPNLTRPKSKQPQLTSEELELNMIRSKGQFKAKAVNKRLFSERLSISSAAVNSNDEGRKSAPPQMTT